MSLVLYININFDINFTSKTKNAQFCLAGVFLPKIIKKKQNF